MDITTKERLINQYLNAYNDFDIQGMLDLLTQDVLFKNFSGDEQTFATKGKDEFKVLAEQGAQYFTQRQQIITDIEHFDDKSIIELDYYAIVGTDLPNGLKAGEELKLKGRSIFKFGEDKISSITDVS